MLGATFNQATIVLMVFAAPVMLVVTGHVLLDVEVSYMTRDVAAIAGIHPLAGFLSSFCILLWSASAAIWFFSARIHSRRLMRREHLFALSSGLASAYFALDDLFQFHESLAPTYLGLPEKGGYVLIAITFCGYLFYFLDQIRVRFTHLFVLSILFLAASVGVDLLPPKTLWRLEGYSFLLEDGLKWAGIVSWLWFCVNRCEIAMLELTGD